MFVTLVGSTRRRATKLSHTFRRMRCVVLGHRAVINNKTNKALLYCESCREMFDETSSVDTLLRIEQLLRRTQQDVRTRSIRIEGL